MSALPPISPCISVLAGSSLFLSHGPSLAGWTPIIGVYFLFIALTAYDMVARLGGDKFGVLLCPIEGDPASSAQRLCEAVRHLSFETGHPLEDTRISATIGLARYPDDARDVNALIVAADRAMY